MGRRWSRPGALGPRVIAGAPVAPLTWLGFTFPFNLSGQPAATLPAGWTAAGLPVGLQLVGRPFGERAVLRLAAAFEAAFPWQGRRPAPRTSTHAPADA